MTEPPKYTRYFYDTEFLEDGRTIELISIGIVADDGREYYAVNADMNVIKVQNHPWLKEHVWPHIPKLNLGPFAVLDGEPEEVKWPTEIATEVRDFLLAGERPELWAWYSAYDHVVLCQLWGPMVDLPKGIPMWTNDLRQEMHRLDRIGEHMDLPEQEHGQHNALEDARHLKRRFDHMTYFTNEEETLTWR